MLRPRLLPLAVALLALLPRPGWSEDAVSLGQLTARAEALRERSGREEISAEEIQDLESGFISLLRQDPENREAASRLTFFYFDWGWTLKRPHPVLLDLVRASRDPAEMVRIFVEPGGEGAYVLQAQIALAALASRPSDPTLWDMAAQVVPDLAWKLAFQEEALRTRLAAPSASSGVPTAPALAARWLSRLLLNGFSHRALVAYRELAPEIRAAIDDDTADPDGRFHDFGNERRDLRLELAAAAFLEGDRETAGRLLRIVLQDPAVRPPLRDYEEQDTLLLLRRLMERALAAPPDDPFDLLTEHLTDFVGDWALVSVLLNARVAEREAYPALAAYELEDVAYSFRHRENEPFEPASDVPARVRTRREEIEAEREWITRSLEDQVRAAQAAARTSLGPDPMAPTIARLLAAPAAPVFAERPLPQGIQPLPASREQVQAQLKEAARRVRLPSGLSVVRIEQKGERVAAIVESQSLDPAGEVTAGGYWVLLSLDGGATWGAPLYTGLRLNRPYVVRPVSTLSLFGEDDNLRLEVEVRDLDADSITFPPVGLAARRTAQGLFLDLPLAALTRDRDGDGVTDLVEARLLTDPQDADSDGDGLADGDDPLPGVPQSADTSAATRALAAVVEKIAGVGARALIEGEAGTPAGVSCCGPRKGPPVIEPTVFFLGERPLFAGLRPDRRLVVLTHAEAEAAAKTFVPFYPLKLELFLFDHTGRRAFVVWSASWQGGVLRLEEKNGQWTVDEVSSWIT